MCAYVCVPVSALRIKIKQTGKEEEEDSWCLIVGGKKKPHILFTSGLMLQSLSISISCPLLHCLRAEHKLWMLIKKERNSVSGINSERVTQKCAGVWESSSLRPVAGPGTPGTWHFLGQRISRAAAS